MDVTKYSRPRTLGDLIAHEYDPLSTRERGVAKAGSGAAVTIDVATVLGQVELGALSVAVTKTAAANTGTVTSPAVAAGTPVGAYKATCIEPGTNAGVFELEGPDGAVLGSATVGVAFTLGGLSGTITDGSTDWSAGEIITLTVTAADGSDQYAPVSATATDGRQYASGIAAKKVIVPDGDTAPIDVLKRGPIVVREAELVWPSGATDDQKAAWIAQLAELNPPILVR